YFDDGNKQMLIIYREEYIEEIVGIIEKMDIKNPMRVYVFSPSEDPATLLFESVEDKVRLTALPAAIYNVYKRILPKKRDKVIFVDKDKEENDTESIGGLFGKGGEK
ncbi:MAG: site-specific DNA-methyltransferase, partial [Muribaculaceae bacterium]|nr:site-specific DNA-methyltransferase [Muribaculaceae bacterium]